MYHLWLLSKDNGHIPPWSGHGISTSIVVRKIGKKYPFLCFDSCVSGVFIITWQTEHVYQGSQFITLLEMEYAIQKPCIIY